MIFSKTHIKRVVFILRGRFASIGAKGMDIVCPTLGLTPERVDFYQIAKEFADKELRPLSSSWDRSAEIPVDTFKKFASIGFSGLFVEQDYGGTNLSRSDTMPIIEALSTGCVSVTALLTIHNANALIFNKYGNEEQRKKWLSKLVNMELFASFCLTEPGSGSDAASLQTKAVYDSIADEYIINGNKAFISGAGLSDLYLVMCRTGENSISCVVVPKGTPGLSFGAKEDKMGWNCQPTRQVIFEDVRVPAANRLSKEGDGFKIAMGALDGARLSIGSCSTGAAQACFEIALNHVKERKQFNHRIADFQSTQFKLADMAGKIVSSRLMLRQAAALLDEDHPAASIHCAIAKKVATDQGFEVCNDALQLLGGYGYLKDYDVERYVRDVRVHQILEGTNEIMRHIVGRTIVGL